jgi:hypothetical protein
MLDAGQSHAVRAQGQADDQGGEQVLEILRLWRLAQVSSIFVTSHISSVWESAV